MTRQDSYHSICWRPIAESARAPATISAPLLPCAGLLCAEPEDRPCLLLTCARTNPRHGCHNRANGDELIHRMQGENEELRVRQLQAPRPQCFGEADVVPRAGTIDSGFCATTMMRRWQAVAFRNVSASRTSRNTSPASMSQLANVMRPIGAFRVPLQMKGRPSRVSEQDLVEQHLPAGSPANALSDVPTPIARPSAVNYRGSPKRIARRDEIEDEMTARTQVVVNAPKQYCQVAVIDEMVQRIEVCRHEVDRPAPPGRLPGWRSRPRKW